MPEIAKITRPSADLIEGIKAVGAAAASSTLAHMGLRNCHITGPVSWNKGKSICGPALTLQFMPKREDLYGDGEYADVEKQLHRHVLYQVEKGDVFVVDALGDITAGVFGDMMMTYFRGRGGAGMVIDGAIRDFVNVQKLDVPLWLNGVTPNFHTQTGLMPWAVNVAIACGGVTVIPGDIIVADDDGAVCVPVALAAEVIENANKHHDWEDFSRMKLMQGAPLQDYYPLHDSKRAEYEEWRKTHPVKK
jgi:regulator of RNase E activity RraA